MISISSAEQIDARDSVRSELYSSLYMRSYKHGSTRRGTAYVDDSIGAPEDDLVDDDLPTPLDPAERSSSPFVAKPYIPPSRVNGTSRLPFGSALDGPLG